MGKSRSFMIYNTLFINHFFSQYPSAILFYQNNERVAKLLYEKKAVGIVFFSRLNFCTVADPMSRNDL